VADIKNIGTNHHDNIVGRVGIIKTSMLLIALILSSGF